jgi:hypothetical protein
MEIEGAFVCVYCFQLNTTLVDGSAGIHQEYVEDCQICCRPNNLTIALNPRLKSAEIHAELI